MTGTSWEEARAEILKGIHLDVMSRVKHEKKLYRNIAYNIRTRRKELGMTQAELALATDMLQPAISRYERQKYRSHTVAGLCRIAFELQTTVADLVTIHEESL